MSKAAVAANNGRLASAVASGQSAYSVNFNYDRYGNAGCSVPAICGNLSFNGATNRESDWTYDSNGNVKATASCTYSYDAEGRMTSFSTCASQSTVYNVLGEAVEATYGGQTYEYIYDPFGNVLGADTGSTWVFDNVPLPGGMSALYENNSSGVADTFFVYTNNIGTTSIVTNHAASVVEDQLVYPWGQGWQLGGSSIGNTDPFAANSLLPGTGF